VSGTKIETKNEFPETKIFAMPWSGKNSPEKYFPIANGLGFERVF
jgi:hypothetical protein